MNIKTSALVLLLSLCGLSARGTCHELLAVGLKTRVLGGVATLKELGLLLGGNLLMSDFAVHMSNIVKQFNFNAC